MPDLPFELAQESLLLLQVLSASVLFSAMLAMVWFLRASIYPQPSQTPFQKSVAPASSRPSLASARQSVAFGPLEEEPARPRPPIEHVRLLWQHV